MRSTAAVQTWKLMRWLGVGLVCAVCLQADVLRAQDASNTEESAADNTGKDGEDTSEEEETVRPTLDLGRFEIKDLRPTRNETAKVTFAMHLAFSEKLSEKQLKLLEGWKHRLRDQVITAVRVSTVKDFQEPTLDRMRRQMRIRVNRLFDAKLVEEVLLTEYLFRTN